MIIFLTVSVLSISCLFVDATKFTDFYKENLFADFVCSSSATELSGTFYNVFQCALKCVRTDGCLSFFYDGVNSKCYSVEKVLTSRSGCASKPGASYYIRQADIDCYGNTQEDLNRILQQTVPADINCESYLFHVYTGGNNDDYRGCGSCHCCKWKGCVNGTPRNYNGTWSQTKYGRRCQRWDKQQPHEHILNVQSYFPADKSAYDAHNYCRDPDYEGSPWCYTSDPSVRWEFCSIPKC